tara:strand:+ start:540190 stop:541155 length:966 start_codon:yes stop_codon:yes gene_type:complete
MSQAAVSDYIPVSVSTLLPAEEAGIAFYQRDDSGENYVLYCADDLPLLEENLNRLRARGVKQLFIEGHARDSYQEYLRGMIESGPSDEVSGEARAGALNHVMLDVLESSFRGGDTNETVSAAMQLGSMTADIVCCDQFAAGDLFKVLHHDYATFTHSANVALYAGMLAKEMGLSEKEVQQITTGGLLHDLGKLEIDDKILSKPGKLDESEFRAIKMHPTRGLNQVSFRKDLNEGQLMMVYQHHERLDGRGYPVGVAEDEIHLWAKICAVVDVFEALTSHRSYRSPMAKPRVLELMNNDSGKAFDPEILACWVKITHAFWAV